MPTVDDFGVWENIGTVVPSFDWQFFQLFPQTPNSTFRVLYFGSFADTFYPRVFLRGAYFSGSQYFFDEKWVRLYPKDEPEIVQIPYPADLQNDPLPQRQIQIKFANRYRYSSLTPGLSIQLLEKVSSNVSYPVNPATGVGSVQGGQSGGGGNIPPGLL